jgi:thioredoxin 1
MSVQRVPVEEIEERIRQAERPVVLDFWMDNCPPCNALAPTLRSVADAYEGRLEVLQVKVDERAPLLKQYDIKGMPTVLFFKGGRIVDRMGGLIRREELREAFERVTENT